MIKIKTFIDPSHSGWILGGIFREIYMENQKFYNKPKIISRLRSRYIIPTLIHIFDAIIKRSPIIFSSLTPLQNFVKIWPYNSNLKFLWYTHSEVVLTKKTINLLNSTQIIFVHSSDEKEKLINYGINSLIIPVIGAIQSEYFKEMPTIGDKIVWIGTFSPRKNAELALNFVKQNPKIQFKFFVKNWDTSELAKIAKSLDNVEYHEINSPLKSMNFNGCSHHLILSEVEGGPMSLLETLASGLIPISTKVGFVEEILCEFGYAEQLINDPSDFTDICEKYNNIYTDEHRKKLTLKVKDYSYKRLSDRIVNEIYATIYTSHEPFKIGINK